MLGAAGDHAKTETTTDDIEDFIRTLEKKLKLCDTWDERIKGSVVSGRDQGVAVHDAPPSGHTIFHS